MKPKAIILLAILCPLSAPSIGAQEVNIDQYLKNESELKTRLWQYEKQHAYDDILLDQTDYDSKYWELHYDVRNISGQILTGKVVLTNQSNIDNLTSIDYNLKGAMTVDTVEMDGGHVAFSRPTNILRIILDRAYNTGELFTTTIYYHGHPYPTGFGSFTYTTHNGVPIVYSFSCPYGARDWWPCKDIQHDKADSADVYITCDTSYTGVSNGVLQEIQENEDSTHTFHWHESYPITSYLICMAVTNYRSFTDWYVGLNGDSLPVTNYVYPENYDNAVIYLSIAPEALHIFASYFGEYPFMMDKFGYSQFPWGGGMEHQENVFLGTSVAWVIVHELGHQWFGDAITCDTWADSWMHEGFATYCQAIHSEGLYGFNSYISYMQNETVSDPSGPIYDYYSIFDVNTIYHKGAWVLHMLRGVMGDSAFFQGMRAYVANPDHLYGTITTREFQHLMEPFYGDSLGWFFDEWVWGMNRPFYLYSWMKQDIENGRYEIFLNIRQIQGSPAPSVFTMPIKVYPRINNVDTVITVWDDARIDDFRFIVDGNPDSLFLDEMPWILHNSSLGSYAMNIVTTSLPDGHIGDVYLDTIEARGGTPPYHFILQSGHLPTGLTLSDGGIISGTPTLVEADSFTVRCTDSSSPARTDVQFYNVTIAPPAGCQYILGDINDDNSVNGIDIVYAVNYLKGGGNPPPIDCGNPVGPCPEPSPFFAAGDVNGNCEFNGVDITFFVRFLKLQVPSLLACSDCPPLP